MNFKVFSLLVIPMCFLFQLFKISFNFTSSMPIGIYQRFEQRKIFLNDLISVCLPKPMAAIGKHRGYIGFGSCPNNSTPLLKELIALPGDTVVLSQSSITVNGVTYYTPQQKFDHNHKRIKHWVKNGVYKHIKGVWVYGSHDPIHSWDSRYFGGIPVKNIQGIYKPLWVFS